MRFVWWVSFFCLICGVQVAAQAGDDPINDSEWRALTDGKTVVYQQDGKLIGREYYAPGQNFLTFETPDGRCVEGVWAFTEGRFCFWYGDKFQCFAHVRRDGKILSLSESGEEPHQIERIVDEPLHCTAG